MAVNLASLARQAGKASGGNIFGQVRPYIAGREEAVSGPDAWMSQAMNMLEEGIVKRLRNQRMKDGGGDITEEGCVPNQVSLDPESRR